MGMRGCIAARIVILGICILVLPVSAVAWEFQMAGFGSYAQSNYFQNGKSGFFGPYDVDNSTGGVGAFAAENGWLGPQVGDMVTGSTAARSSFSTSLFPRLRINPAVTMQGVYRIGNVDTDVVPGATVAFADGEWLQWWAMLKTPLGLVAVGKRPFDYGLGLQFDSGNRTQEHVALVTYTGPFCIGLGLYTWRAVPELNDLTERLYSNSWDQNGTGIRDLYAFLNYECGAFEGGVAALYYDFHQGPEGADTPALRANSGVLDCQSTEGSIYLKYAPGNFFFNAEAAWYYRNARWQRSTTGLFQGPDAVYAEVSFGSSVWRPQYTESWRFLVQTGAIAGPAKLTLFYSFVPGPDRRHGVLIDRQPVPVDLYRLNTIAWNPDQGNTGAFRPFSLLLSTNYGAGVGALNRGANGYIVDASVFAGRVDYAVAANLNLFASFLYAERVSHGYGWGYITPTAAGGVAYAPTGTFADPAPAIPDNALGWEVTAGMTWNLLDSWILDVSAAYWQPGRWFNYACIDKAVPAWDVPAAGNFWGVSPDRTIDPVMAVITSLMVNF
ncbi:MAG: hypothetical protein V1792_16305 [Pseudomonadota bacterium]